MPVPGKLYRIEGEGSPLTSRETLVVAMLLHRGFRLLQSPYQKNFQDVTRPDDSRYFVFVFDGMHQVEGQFPGQYAEEIYANDGIYEAFEPGENPIEALKELDPPESLVDYFRSLLIEIRTMPRHLEIHRGKARYWFPMDWSAEEMEQKMRELDNG